LSIVRDGFMRRSDMATVNVLVLRAPGTNCDVETQFAFEQAGARVERMHINRLVETPRFLDDFQILCVPGGFSYGDDLSAGKILATILRHRLGDQLQAFRDRGRLMLGICNGFQALLKTGLLIEEDPATSEARATLTLNTHGYQDRWVHLKVTPGRCAFFADEEILEMPIAHAEGNFAVRRPELIDELTAAGRIVARYVDARGEPGPFPVNPNGAMGDVAGVCDRTGRVFALMPHPERHLSPYQHPCWTRRREQPPTGDGFKVFANAVRYFL
jgi:phosphoribosylformylglycinamidine synthase